MSTRMERVAREGLLLIGCGKMGSALLKGWLAGGVPPGAVWVLEPHPSDWLRAQGVHVGEAPPQAPAVAVVAVKPQAIDAALPLLAEHCDARTLVLSIAAGVPISRFTAALGPEARVVRAMPNTPAAVGRGVSALVAGGAAAAEDLDLAEALLSAVGQTVRLDDEAQMDAVTAVSGSGPAYVFHLIECLAEAGEAEGLPPPLAMQLARATVAGAGALAESSGESPEQLRINVTSPGGTTQAGLAELMDPARGLCPLIRRTVAAAARRSRELGEARDDER